MICCTTKNKYCITLVVTIIIFLILNICIGFIIQKIKAKDEIFFFKTDVKQEHELVQSNFITSETSNNSIISQNINKANWQIVIPKIGLSAPINEGTSQNIIKHSIGHFENSSIWQGNVALAAHNRGYLSNFFENIKQLEIGDQILYITEYGRKKYKVSNITKIQDNDWSYIENTNENKITLITCIENMPGFRLCVQGIEI